MEINDEHEVGAAYALKTMLSDRESSRRHLLASIANHTTTRLLLVASSSASASASASASSSSYQSNASQTLHAINITEANVINSWNIANSSNRLLNLQHFTNHSYDGNGFDNGNATTLDVAGDAGAGGDGIIDGLHHFGYNNSSSMLNFFNTTLGVGGGGEMKDVLSFWDVWASKPFPSGYTQLAIVLLALFITCIMILVVVGNMLVCIAITTEKSLKPVQNWFIASLAVSDLLIGLVIMPFSLARELMGYWMFGQVWCDIHAALDVLLCTASINNLFLISLDRYWSITQAVKYLKKRTQSRAAFMIAFVWIFSALVSLPPLVGWKKKGAQSSEFPQCNISDDIGYVLYSSIGSFYFPALMMVFVYARIFIAARSRARKHLEKKRLKISNKTQLESMQTTTTLRDKATAASTGTAQLCTSFSSSRPGSSENVMSDNNNPSSQLQLTTTNGPPPPTTTTTTTTTMMMMTTVAVTTTTTDSSNNAPDKNDDSLQTTTTTAAAAAAAANYENINLVNEKSSKPSPPQIIIESSDSRRQSWNIISTSELISSITTDQLSLQMGATDHAQAEMETSTGGNLGTEEEQPQQQPQQQQQQQHPVGNINGDNNKTVIEAEEITDQSNHSDGSTNRIYFPKLKSMSNKTFKFYKPKLNGMAGKAKASLPKTITVDEDSDTIDSPTTKEPPQSYESKFLSAPKMLQQQSKFGSTMSIADYDESDLIDEDSGGNGKGSKKGGKGRAAAFSGDQPPLGLHITSDAERHKRKIAKARERRATLIVGLIMAAFITAWLPFFVLYLLAALCMSCKQNIPEGVFAVAFWLGYCNSAANPIIYTIFNRDYRRAFRKILFK